MAKEKNNKIWTLVLELRQGNEVHLFKTERLADKFLYDFVREWWDAEIPDEAMPTSQRDAVDAYFYHQNENGTEYYSLSELPVIEE
jgi:hypothetical protein